jgi:NAD(P)H-nitrite reductase large subunit
MNEDDCEFSGAIYDFGMKAKTLNMCSGIVNEKISNQGENLLEEKVKTLLVQNNTLKKELGNYRRQNSLLHR